MPNSQERTGRPLLRPVAGGLLAAAASLAFLTACGDGDDSMTPQDSMTPPDSMTPSDTMTPSDSMMPSMAPDGGMGDGGMAGN